jgi:hypothetical protein
MAVLLVVVWQAPRSNRAHVRTTGAPPLLCPEDRLDSDRRRIRPAQRRRHQTQTALRHSASTLTFSTLTIMLARTV